MCGVTSRTRSCVDGDMGTGAVVMAVEADTDNDDDRGGGDSDL